MVDKIKKKIGIGTWITIGIFLVGLSSFIFEIVKVPEIFFNTLASDIGTLGVQAKVENYWCSEVRSGKVEINESIQKDIITARDNRKVIRLKIIEEVQFSKFIKKNPAFLNLRNFVEWNKQQYVYSRINESCPLNLKDENEIDKLIEKTEEEIPDGFFETLFWFIRKEKAIKENEEHENCSSPP